MESDLYDKNIKREQVMADMDHGSSCKNNQQVAYPQLFTAEGF